MFFAILKNDFCPYRYITLQIEFPLRMCIYCKIVNDICFMYCLYIGVCFNIRKLPKYIAVNRKLCLNERFLLAVFVERGVNFGLMISCYACGVQCVNSSLKCNICYCFFDSFNNAFHAFFLSLNLIIFPLNNDIVADSVPIEYANRNSLLGSTLIMQRINTVNKTIQYIKLQNLNRLYSFFMNGLLM